jgi:hypothetical protein
MTVLHEPFCNLRDYGETDVGARTFDSPLSLLAWLRDETHIMSVFLKDTSPAGEHFRDVLADRRFLAESRHAFLIRRPEEIAASNYALWPGMNINSIGLERLCELQAAVRDAGGTLRLSSTLMTSWHDLKRRWRRTARPLGCPSIHGRSPGCPVSGPSGAGPHAGTWTSVPAPASSCASACTRIPSRTPASWHGSPLTTGRSTNSFTHSGWTLRPGSKWRAPNQSAPAQPLMAVRGQLGDMRP